MELCRVNGRRLIHLMVPLPPIKTEYILATGRKGVAYGADFGELFLAEEFEGKKEDITCKKCLRLASVSSS